MNRSFCELGRSARHVAQTAFRAYRQDSLLPSRPSPNGPHPQKLFVILHFSLISVLKLRTIALKEHPFSGRERPLSLPGGSFAAAGCSSGSAGSPFALPGIPCFHAGSPSLLPGGPACAAGFPSSAPGIPFLLRGFPRSALGSSSAPPGLSPSLVGEQYEKLNFSFVSPQVASCMRRPLSAVVRMMHAAPPSLPLPPFPTQGDMTHGRI